MKIVYWMKGKDGLKQYSNIFNYEFFCIKINTHKILTSGISFYGKLDNGKFSCLFPSDIDNIGNNYLSNISHFYEALNGVEDDNFRILMVSSIVNIEENYFEMYGGQEMGDYVIRNYEYTEGGVEAVNNKVSYSFERGAIGWRSGVEVSGEMTYKEFYLLMQIYFGVYQESELLKTCEEKEKNGVYEGVKDLDHTVGKNNPLFEEYLKLKLMQKDTTGAFNGLQIEKIYDKDWAEEKQKEHIDEINKELGEEVIVWE